MICELCGKRTNKLFTVVIEGVRMQVCGECVKFGKIIHEKFEKIPEVMETKEQEEEELVEDWRERIKKEVLKENKSGKTIEEIAKEWRIKESLLKGIIGGNIEISIELAKKFEKILGISLVRKVKIEKIGKTKRIKEEPMMTLGDIVKIRIRS